MTLEQIYAALRDGSGPDRELDHELNAYTPTVEGAEGYVRGVTSLDSEAVWLMADIPGNRWTSPVFETRDDVDGFAVTGWIGAGEHITEWHAEKARAICMLAMKLRMS